MSEVGQDNSCCKNFEAIKCFMGRMIIQPKAIPLFLDLADVVPHPILSRL